MNTDGDKDINGDWWVRYPYFKDEFSRDRVFDEGWWDKFGLMEMNGERTTPEEVSALRDYLAGRSSISVAARCLMTLAEDRVPVDEDWDKGDRITDLLKAAVIHFPLKQDAIVNLVEEIRSLPEPDLTQEQKVRLGQMWQEWFALEEFEGECGGGRFPVEWSQQPHTSQPWRRSSCAFSATRCIQHRNAAITLHYAGFKLIIQTLEQEPWKWGYWRGWACTIAILDKMVPALVPWFEITGRLIYNYDDRENFSALRGYKNDRSLKCLFTDLWHGEMFFNLGRWKFWKERLEWIAQQESLLKETRDTATQLVVRMNEIEADPQPEIWKDRLDVLDP